MIDAKRAVNAHLYSHLKTLFLEGQQFSKMQLMLNTCHPSTVISRTKKEKSTTFYSFKKVVSEMMIMLQQNHI